MVSFMLMKDGIVRESQINYRNEKYAPTLLTLQSRRAWQIRRDSDASHHRPGRPTGIKDQGEELADPGFTIRQP